MQTTTLKPRLALELLTRKAPSVSKKKLFRLLLLIAIIAIDWEEFLLIAAVGATGAALRFAYNKLSEDRDEET